MSDDFYGLPTQRLENELIALDYLTTVGPRIVRFFLKETKENWLAELPEKYWNTPHGRFHIRGGHRLWHAPENATRTYIPDNDPVMITLINHGVILTQNIEPETHIRKRMTILIDPAQAKVTIHHTLENHGKWAVQLAAWPITMMKLGGTAVIPQKTTTADKDGLLPNRHLVLWPYASWLDGRLHLDDALITVDGRAALPPLKIGCFTPHNWLGYIRGSSLFLKQFQPRPAKPHADMNCNVEIYVNDEILELETQSPLMKLLPQESLTHTETWHLFTNQQWANTPQALTKQIQALITT
ncbi:MAG: hypothetical protein Kow0080_15120 [Candidatus Promineifilaceae bacterium]